MKCPKCQTENTQDSQFCKKCATSLTGVDVAQPSFTNTLETPVDTLSRGSLFADRYEIIEELGKGGMGTVYRVEDTKAKEEIALKLIKPEIASDLKTIERFRNELTTARKIRHKNICGMFDLNEEKGTHFITMEYVPGEDLKSFLRRSRQISIKTAVEIGKQICEGLSEAHRLGVVHRDLKPSNIMIDKEGNARIMDFGIARTIKAKGITGAGVMIGTPEYMSPEQAEAKDVDFRSDLYSLGVILYEMVTGKTPFEGDTPLSIAMKHKGDLPKIPKEYNTQIPDDLSNLILKCLKKNRESRYQSAAELRSDLINIEKGIPTSERTAPGKKSLTSKEITLQFSPKKLLIPALLFGALIITVIMIIKQPWSPKAGVAAPKIENSVAVVNFENQTGDNNFDHLQRVIPSLLRTNLEDTDLFKVVTRERMLDICKQLGREDADFIDNELGFEICHQEGVQALVTGFYTKGGDIFTTAVTVYDVDTKKSLKNTRSSGTGEKSFFEKQIDELTQEISEGLGKTGKDSGTPELGIAAVTTDSMEAYRYYLEGVENKRKQYDNDARIALEKAVQIDPDFAMAYLHLSRAYGGLRNLEARDTALKRAKALSPKATEKERLLIEMNYAGSIEKDSEKYLRILRQRAEKFPKEKGIFYSLGIYYRDRGAFDKAIEEYSKALELDPNYGDVHNVLGYLYLDMEDFSKAVEHLKKHASLNPSEANPHDSLAEAYFWMGRLDEALTSYRNAMEIKPDFPGIHFRIGYIHALKEEYGDAMERFDRAIPLNPPALQSLGYLWKGFCHYWLGSEEDWDYYLRKAEEVSEELGDVINQRFINWLTAFIHYERGELDQSRENNEAWLNHFSETWPRNKFYYQGAYHFLSGLIECKAGNINAARNKLADLKSIYSEMTQVRKEWVLFYIQYLSAELALKEESPDEAIAVFEEQASYGPDNFSEQNMDIFLICNLPGIRDVLPRAYEQKGDLDGAIAEYEKIVAVDLESRNRQLIHPKYHYRLAKLYEQKGWKGKAIENYEKFLTLWKDADPGLPEVADARRRMARLKQ